MRVLVLAALCSFALLACRKSTDEAPSQAPAASPADEGERAAQPAAGAAAGGSEAVLLALAQFVEDPAGGRPKPGPAKAMLIEAGAGGWGVETLEDPDSIVFHKAMCWPGKDLSGGVLTIGAEGARLLEWRRGPEGWKSTLLYEGTFGGKWDRLRDLEVGNVDADPEPELVIATHDQGVVLVLNRSAEGWEAQEIFRKADTFVHEVELGDVDGDGALEIYVTPSEPNRAGVSQPGGVLGFRFDKVAASYQPFWVVQLENSHAKEILTADLNGDGSAELYAAVEAKLTVEGGQLKAAQPVSIQRFHPGAAGAPWRPEVVATLEGGLQSRVLLAADLRGLGPELVVTTMRDGVWRLQMPEAPGAPWPKAPIDRSLRGFENAAGIADTDGDGRAELFVTPDDLDQVLRYVWDGEDFQRSEVVGLAARDITWNVVACRRP